MLSYTNFGGNDQTRKSQLHIGYLAVQHLPLMAGTGPPNSSVVVKLISPLRGAGGKVGMGAGGPPNTN